VVGYEGLIVSFEPVQANFDLLSEKSKNDPKWYVHDFALGSEDAKRSIKVIRATALSSFLEPDDSSEYYKADHREDAKMRKMDSIIDDLKRLHQPQRIFIKIDTQGHDFQVIVGAERTLADVLGIQMELAVKPTYREMLSYLRCSERCIKEVLTWQGYFPSPRTPC
jgi:FkbM family methyltransferase